MSLAMRLCRRDLRPFAEKKIQYVSEVFVKNKLQIQFKLQKTEPSQLLKAYSA
jgi:hypothetical protein